MKTILVILSMIFLPMQLFPQYLAIYTDYLNKVQLFDHGNIKEIEHLPVLSYQIGDEALGYEDNTSSFKVYYDNYVYTLNEFVTEYVVTDHLVAYRMNTQLKVFDRGHEKNLTIQVGEYKAGDELVAFYDRMSRIFKVYYDARIYELDDAIAANETTEFELGENTLVYLDSRNYYNIFWNGETAELLYEERMKSYKVGRDMVAFVEDPMNNLQVFHKGEFKEIENFEPHSFFVGDGFVAYIDSNNYLKIYDGEETRIISFDAPEFYRVEDGLIIYSVQDYFKVYWNGKNYTLENYVPQDYKYDSGMIVYTDEHGYLKVFDRGLHTTLSYEKVISYYCHGVTAYFGYGVKSNGIYSDGQIYEGD